jgi:hypothetical protein
MLATTLWQLPTGPAARALVHQWPCGWRSLGNEVSSKGAAATAAADIPRAAEVQLIGPDEAGPGLQSLQTLTCLVDLRLEDVRNDNITASMLSGMRFLTHLDLSRQVQLEPSALAGKTRLQHLYLDLDCEDAEDVAQLLSNLQHMQQLTHLYMQQGMFVGTVMGEAYSALTASSKLRYLDLSGFGLPAGAWQHVFPAGRQLPHLWSLNMWVVHSAPVGRRPVQALEGSCLVRCCPGLKSLRMGSVRHTAALLGPLSGLSRLQRLQLDDSDCTKEGLGALCQLTGLKSLTVVIPSTLQDEGSNPQQPK